MPHAPGACGAADACDQRATHAAGSVWRLALIDDAHMLPPPILLLSLCALGTGTSTYRCDARQCPSSIQHAANCSHLRLLGFCFDSGQLVCRPAVNQLSTTAYSPAHDHHCLRPHFVRTPLVIHHADASCLDLTASHTTRWPTMTMATAPPRRPRRLHIVRRRRRNRPHQRIRRRPHPLIPLPLRRRARGTPIPARSRRPGC